MSTDEIPLHQLEIAVAILTVVALLLAIYTVYDVKRVYKSAEKIAESVTTKYVGFFPHNMDEIIKVISSTRRELIIVCDVPKYGHFSNPWGFDKYNQALRSLLVGSTKPKITLIVYDKERRMGNSKAQFNMPYNDIEESKEFIDYFEYHKNNPTIKKPTERSTEGFYQWLEEKHALLLKEWASIGVHIFECKDPFRFYAWISDDHKAVFSFYNYGYEPREVSFKSKDQSLIKILKNIAEATIEGLNEYSCD